MRQVAVGESGDRVEGGRAARVGPLVGMAGKTAGEAVAASLRKRRQGGDLTEFHTRQAQRYAERLGRSRGVLMKAGQMMSFVTLDPAVETPYRGIYQEAFARLQDDAPPMPARLVRETVAAELGKPPAELFAEFDAHPLAAASIGQVHAATLHDGRRVAVKVQYPGVEEAIRADLANTELLATFFQLVFTVMPGLSRMDVRDIAREVADRIGEEVDYRAEARNQQEFADLYRGHPFIRVPEVVPELSSRRVLTMELSDGIRYAKALAAEQSLRDRWGEAIYRFFSANLVLRGLFNADPHPGNYLFHPDGSVTFVDFGCVKRFTSQQVKLMEEVVHATVAQDAQRLASATLHAGFFGPKDPPSPDAVLAMMVESRPDLVGPQPYTYAPETSAQALRSVLSPRGSHGAVVRKMSGAADYVFISRVDSGMTAVLGGLRATGPWWPIRQEYSNGAPPSTPYGALDLAHQTASR